MGTDQFAEGDRVLFLYIPDAEEIAALSRAVPNGIVVCLGDRDEVYVARKNAAHLENVMFVPADPHEIPWQEGFFNHVWERGIAAEAAFAEIVRVLAPGGALYAQSAALEVWCEGAGLVRQDQAWRKAEG